jgi:hypothetical protein
MSLVCCPPSSEEFGEDFAKSYYDSIAKARRENENTIKSIRGTLAKNRELRVPLIDSGLSFFCGLNPSDNLRKLSKESGKTPSQFYVDHLFEEKNILINDGSGTND